jgi:hypothetical protein
MVGQIRDLSSGIEVMVHDFFTEQSVEDITVSPRKKIFARSSFLGLVCPNSRTGSFPPFRPARLRRRHLPQDPGTPRLGHGAGVLPGPDQRSRRPGRRRRVVRRVDGLADVGAWYRQGAHGEGLASAGGERGAENHGDLSL